MIVKGSSVDTNLLIAKICSDDLGYNETVCDNLNNDVYDKYESEGEINQSLEINAFCSIVRKGQK